MTRGLWLFALLVCGCASAKVPTPAGPARLTHRRTTPIFGAPTSYTARLTPEGSATRLQLAQTRPCAVSDRYEQPLADEPPLVTYEYAAEARCVVARAGGQALRVRSRGRWIDVTTNGKGEVFLPLRISDGPWTVLRGDEPIELLMPPAEELLRDAKRKKKVE